MTASEQLRSLLAEIGPVLDLAEVYEATGGRTWTLMVRDGATLFADLMPDDSRLWLSAEVGTPPPENRIQLYTLMLVYNAQWQQTAGVRLALDRPDGAITLAYDMPVAGLDMPSLCTVIRNFCDMRDGWQRIVADASSDRKASGFADGPVQPDDQGAGMIRV